MKKALPFLISAVITAVVMVVISFFIEDTFQAKSTLISGLIAVVVIGTIPIYDINRWSLFKRSFVHFLIMVVTVFPLILYSGWFNPLLSAGLFILFGIVGWTIGYFANKLQVKASIDS